MHSYIELVALIVTVDYTISINNAVEKITFSDFFVVCINFLPSADRSGSAVKSMTCSPSMAVRLHISIFSIFMVWRYYREMSGVLSRLSSPSCTARS